MTNKNDFLNIPIDLLGYAIRYRLVNQLRLYITLKSLYNGQFKWNNKNRRLISDSAGYGTIKTFNRNMDWLIQHKWVTFKKGYAIIKSFKKLALKLKLYGHGSVIFIPSFDLASFRPFMYGALITYYMKQKRIRTLYSGTEKGSPYKKYRYSSYDMPHTYLAKILGISKASAHNYRREAYEAGYLDVSHTYEDLSLHADSIELYRKYAGNGRQLRLLNDEPNIQLPDKIKSNMIVKRKRDFRSLHLQTA